MSFCSGGPSFPNWPSGGFQPAMECPMMSQAVAEYIWLDNDGQIRSRTKVLEGSVPQEAEGLPCLVVDGRVPASESADELYEVVLRPRKIFKDPFRSGSSILVLCDAYEPPATSNESRAPSSLPMAPLASNSRAACEGVMKGAASSEPVLSCEQEYVVVHPAYPTLVPVGPAYRSKNRRSRLQRGARSSSSGGSSTSHGNQHQRPKGSHSKASTHLHHHSQHYDEDTIMEMDPGPCSVRIANPAMNRQIADLHLRCCLHAGIRHSGGGASSSTPGAWFYKVGPCRGTEFGDDVWVSRYLLTRVAEQLGVCVSFDPDQAPGGDECNGAASSQLGCHVRFSSAQTRDSTKGLFALEEQLSRLQAQHVQHAWSYCNGRLTSILRNKHLVSFVYAVANCSASVMVPSMTMLRRSGYYVDRRPPADCDPYKVAMLLASTALQVPLPLSAVCKPPLHGLDLPALAAQLQAHGATTVSCGMWPAAVSGSLSGISEACGSAGEDSEEDMDDESLDTDDLLLDELEKMDGGAGMGMMVASPRGSKGSRSGLSGCSGGSSGAISDSCERGGRCFSDGSIPHVPRAGTSPHAAMMAALGVR